MTRTLQSLAALALAGVPAIALADATQDEIRSLEARIAQLESESAAHAAPAPTDNGHLKINGFMSAGFGRADIDDFSYGGLYERWSHKTDSVIGVQIDARVNDRTHAVAQLVGDGSEDFAVNAEWAYVGYRAGDSDELRIGRQRYAFFMMSEYLDVGYAYPWAQPPEEVYLPWMPSAFDGVAWKHRAIAGDWTHDLQAYWGSARVDVNGGTLNIENGGGFGLASAVGSWQFSATYSQASLTFTNPFFDALGAFGVTDPLYRDHGWFGGLGAQYDDGRLLVMGETTRINVKGYFPDTTHSYLTLGYRFGRVMPHLTWATMRTTDHANRPDYAGYGTLCSSYAFCMPGSSSPFPPGALSRALDSGQDSATLGVRYDFRANAALKVDWTHVLDTHDTFGLFTRDDGNVFTGAMPGNNINIYRVVVDVVF